MINDVDTKLNNALGVVEVAEKELALRVKPIEEKGEELSTDFSYSRENLYNIIERGQDAMEGLLQVARETEHPRAYEVVGQLMDKLTNANKELMNIHKQKKDVLKDDSNNSPQNVTNALFVGSTADLQKLLKQNKETKM
jgi:hypothetical protein